MRTKETTASAREQHGQAKEREGKCKGERGARHNRDKCKCRICGARGTAVGYQRGEAETEQPKGIAEWEDGKVVERDEVASRDEQVGSERGVGEKRLVSSVGLVRISLPQPNHTHTRTRHRPGDTAHPARPTERWKGRWQAGHENWNICCAPKSISRKNESKARHPSCINQGGGGAWWAKRTAASCLSCLSVESLRASSFAISRKKMQPSSGAPILGFVEGGWSEATLPPLLRCSQEALEDEVFIWIGLKGAAGPRGER